MNTKVIVSSAFALLLLLSAPTAFASEGKGEAGLHLGIGKFLGFNGDASARAEMRKDHDEDRDEDHDEDREARKERREAFRAEMAERLSHISAGIVTSINGSIFTIDPFGAKSTTTVTTTSGTTFKAKGEATTSSALTVGSKVFLFGTTTATSSTGDSFTASIVKLVGEGWGHFKFWFGLGHRDD